MSEQALIKAIQVAVSMTGGRVHRNNIGAYKDRGGRFITYGVCNPGGADLIGWTAQGRFLAVEVKYGRTRTTAAQVNFIRAVNEAGGVGIVARSVEDVICALNI